MLLRAWVPLVLLTMAVVAQQRGVTVVRGQPLGVDWRSRLGFLESGHRDRTKGTGSWPARGGASPAEVARSWWLNNRDRWLPKPEPRTSASRPPALVRLRTTAVAADRQWLLAAARVLDGAERAAALFALGCVGPSARGIDLLIAAIDDSDERVRQAALLGLGEHGGTRARFEFVKIMNDDARPQSERRLAVLAFGIAAAIDGDVGGLELRRFAAVVGQPTLLDASCAADTLHGRDVLAPLAADWVARGGEGLAMALPCAASAWTRADVVPAVTGCLRANRWNVRTSARAVAARYGEVTTKQLRSWVKDSDPAWRARFALSVVWSPNFAEIAKERLADPVLRGVWALGYAVNARLTGRRGAVRDLAAAARKQGTLAERPLWLLACHIAGDVCAEVRATVVLNDAKGPVEMRLAAVDVLAMAGGEALAVLRRALAGDPDVSVRLFAADGLARYGGSDNVASLLAAVDAAADDSERAALLDTLGRTRDPAADIALRRYCGDAEASEAVRSGAWSGLAHALRWSGGPQLARLPHGMAFDYLPEWLFALAVRYR